MQAAADWYRAHFATDRPNTRKLHAGVTVEARDHEPDRDPISQHNPRMDRTFLLIGALAAFLGVALGAFGAHALRARLSPQSLEVFESGVRYQMYHALGLFAVAWARTQWANSYATAAGWLFVAGTLFFSGSLYALAMTGTRSWGAVAPIGGGCFIAGWACLVVAAMRR